MTKNSFESSLKDIEKKQIKIDETIKEIESKKIKDQLKIEKLQNDKNIKLLNTFRQVLRNISSDIKYGSFLNVENIENINSWSSINYPVILMKENEYINVYTYFEHINDKSDKRYYSKYSKNLKYSVYHFHVNDVLDFMQYCMNTAGYYDRFTKLYEMYEYNIVNYENSLSFKEYIQKFP